MVDSQSSSGNKQNNDYKMTILDHLEEVRSRIFKSLVAVVICFVFCFIYSKNLIEVLICIAPSSTEFVQIAPGEVFIVSVKVAIYAAIYFASPVIFYQIVKFLSPGLKNSEKNLLYLSF